MRNIATIPARDREALFRNTAAKMGMSEAIIEKDFWVCYMLDYSIIWEMKLEQKPLIAKGNN